jgi:hypothetical protein
VIPFLQASHYWISIACLIVFWVPLFLPKGANSHQRWGALFLFFNLLSILTAFILIWYRLKTEALSWDRVQVRGFMLFIGMLNFSALWYAWRLHQVSHRPLGEWADWLITCCLVLISFGALWFGLVFDYALMVYWGPVGLIAAMGQILLYRIPARPFRSRHWKTEHFASVCLCYLTAATAAAVTIGKKFFDLKIQSLWIWLPPLAFVLALFVLGRLFLSHDSVARRRILTRMFMK